MTDDILKQPTMHTSLASVIHVDFAFYEQINSLTSAILSVRYVQTSSYRYLRDASQLSPYHQPDGKSSAKYSS